MLETTDVHANLLPYDYYADTCETSYGLARTASLIRKARAEAPNCLLFDNGDFLQGTPLSDLTAQDGSGWDDDHPAVTAMNHLQYDAAGVGNHEFNFGLDWLQRALASASFPVTCANAVTRKGAVPTRDKTLFSPYLILNRTVVDSDGESHELRIGILALVPPQITIWDHFHLKDRLTARDMLESAGSWVPHIREKGADLVVLLAHSGIDADPYYPKKENAALSLAELDGVDAILAGHTHEIFPDESMPEIAGVNQVDGTLHGTPTVMAGFRGSHLGVLDLFLQRDGSKWSVAAHRSEARCVLSDETKTPTGPDETLVGQLQPVHQKTLELIQKPLGHVSKPLHTYLATVRNDPATQLITRAKRAAAYAMVQGTDDVHLPVLSSAAPFKTGSRGGPKYFSEVPVGEFRLRNAADLYPFPNTLCILRVTGADLQDWLERAASCFNQILPDRADQPLLDPAVPGHAFDVIDGLTYEIDLSQPAQYDGHGRQRSASTNRIQGLAYQGVPLDDSQLFLLATNSFRAYGGGPYRQMPDRCFAVTSRVQVRDIIAQYVRDREHPVDDVTSIWSFASIPGASVTIDTGPGVQRYKDEIAAIDARELGLQASGFLRLGLSLDQTQPGGLAKPEHRAYVTRREVGAGERLANPVRSGRKQP